MENILGHIEKIVPDELPIFIRRYELLRAVYIFQPVGRRMLSLNLDLPERAVRADIDTLKRSGLMDATKAGMLLTTEGEAALRELEGIIGLLNGLSTLEKKLGNILGVKKTVIVDGDCGKSIAAKKEIGRAAARVLAENVTEESIIAVTGGSTIAAVAGGIAEPPAKKAALVLPARGSLGRAVEFQSDTIAARLAELFGAKNRLLSVPDNLSSKTLSELRNEPSINKTLSKLKMADILLFGIGGAMDMAVKRKVSNSVYETLERRHAVAEALGSYFNSDGAVVYETGGVGIKFQDIGTIPCVIAAAGGEEKAEAILAVCRMLGPRAMLVTDRGAAEKIVRLAGR